MSAKLFKRFIHIDNRSICGIKTIAKVVKAPYYPLHTHDFFEIEWIVEGELHHELNGIGATESKGTVISVSTTDIHKYEFVGRPTIYALNIDYKNTPKAIQHIFSKVSFPLVAHLSEEELSEINELFLKIHALIINETEDDEFLSDKVLGYTLILLSKIFKCSKSMQSISKSNSYYHIAKVMKYVSEHYSEDLTLVSIAKEVALSPCYLSAVFKKLSSVSIMEYINDVRLQKAQSESLNGLKKKNIRSTLSKSA